MSFGRAVRLTCVNDTKSKTNKSVGRAKSSPTTSNRKSENLYRNLCQESKAVYQHKIVKMLRKGVIQVVISRGSIDENTMTVFGKLLREIPRDTVIVDIRREGRFHQKPTSSSSKHQHVEKLSSSASSSSISRRRNDENKNLEVLISKLIRGLSQMLRSNESSLQSVRLSGISMTGSNMKRFASGVAQSKSLKHLIIERSDVNDMDFGVLCKALKDHTSLLILSVNRCSLTNVAAHSIQQLMKSQCLRRDHERWLNGLRDDNNEIANVALRGLQVLDLSGHENITDQTGEILAKALMYVE